MTKASQSASAPTLEEAVENAKLGILVWDTVSDDSPIIYANEAFGRITQYSPDDVVGKDWTILHGETTDPEVLDRLEAAVASGEDASARLVLARADGSPLHAHVLLAPVHEDDGSSLASLCILKEETEHAARPSGAQRPDHLTASDVMLQEIQHRVKNHLAMIVALIRKQSKRDITNESFTALSHRIEALALLYDELLQPTSKDSSKAVSAGSYLSRVASVIASLDGRPSIRLNLECNSIPVDIDRAGRLGLLLTELLTNAFNHAFRGRQQGSITVRFHRIDHEYMELSVEDDGVGLPPGSTWPKGSQTVATHRHRADTEPGLLDTTSGTGSSGLGGSIVTGLTKTLSGSLDVSSGTDGTKVSVQMYNPE